MNLKIPFTIVVSSLAACAVEPPESITEPASEPVDVSDRFGGPEHTADGEQPSAFAPDAPCGDATVATVTTGEASFVAFCARDGHEAIGEFAPLGTPSKLRALDIDLGTACSADVFHALAPDRAIPATLVESCAARPASTVSRKRSVESTQVTPEEMLTASSYCSASGQSNFVSEICSQTPSCSSGNDCSTWCTSAAWGSHDRAMSWQMGGEEGELGQERIASCSGNTRFRAYWRDDVGDAWTLSLDYTVAAGTTASWQMHYSSLWADGDFRFRGDSASNASHRHAGTFQDW